MKVASVSLCEGGCKRVLVGPSFTQGPKGCWGSSGSQGSKTSERGRNRRGETEMGRDRLHGRRAVGRRKKMRRKKKQENKSQGFSLGCDTHPKSPSSENEEADDEGLEVSKNASWLPQEKANEHRVLRPYFTFEQIHSAREGRGWKRMRARALEKGGNRQREQLGDTCAF